MTNNARTKFEAYYGLSDAAVSKLLSSGICEEAASAAGIYSVENAKQEVHDEFLAQPALVFPYFDKCGNVILFERDGARIPFVRVRYLYVPQPVGFTRKAQQRYAQLRGSGVHAYLPKGQGINWEEVFQDTGVNLVITEGELKALKGCQEGIATIGVGGVDCFQHKVEAWAN